MTFEWDDATNRANIIKHGLDFDLAATAGGTMAKKKVAVSSQPERLVRRSEADIRAYAKSPAAKEASEHLRAHIRSPR
jgi:uncharacterized DUF497 family protein